MLRNVMLGFILITITCAILLFSTVHLMIEIIYMCFI